MNNCFEKCPFTLNTTRICGHSPIESAIQIARIGYINMKPNAVILVNKSETFDGIGAAPLVHFPINGPILFTDGKSLNEDTLNEIQSLSPKGYKGIHVILVGNISKRVALELNSIGLKTHHVAGRNHYETACMIPDLREEFKNILILSGEDYSEGISASYWSAHHGDPILFVQKNRIPDCTLDTIKKYKHINVYIIGSTKTISKDVERHLSMLDNIKRLVRIHGENPNDIAVNFSKYKDSKNEFGWARNYREGHVFTFGDLRYPMEIIAGVLFAHMGKHTPLLLSEKGMLPKEVKEYIKSVKPMPPKDMPKPPFLHGFIVGDTESVSYDGQIQIEDTLSIEHEMMGHDIEMDEMDDNIINMKDEIMDMNDYDYMSKIKKLEEFDFINYNIGLMGNEKGDYKDKYGVYEENKFKKININCVMKSIEEIIN